MNLDNAYVEPLENIYKGKTFKIRQERYSDDAGTVPENWPTTDYEIKICADSSGQEVVMTIIPTVTGNVLEKEVNDAQNILEVGKYYYFMIGKYGANHTQTEAKGPVTVIPSA